MKHNLKKILPKLILFLIVTIVVIIVILSLNDISEIGSTLKNVDIRWLLVAFLFLFLYMAFYPLPLYFLGKSKEEKNVSFLDTGMIGTMEYFFNGITPFSSGGQPFQIYSYSKVGVSFHRASGIILMNFVICQISVLILCLGSLFYFNELTQGTLHLQIMIGVGLGMNLLITSLFCSVGLSKHVRNLLSKFVGWILNWKIFKGKLARFEVSFQEYCAGAQSTFKALLSQKLKFVGCIFLKLIGLLAYYMIPFFILRALRIEVELKQLLLITAMSTFAIAMTCYIPTPGATGGIEFAFQSLFVTAIPAISPSIATSGLLLWRFITYYFLMLVSFIVYIIFEQVVARRNRKEKKLEAVEENPLQNSEE
ncbi:MAG: flippase-like domain-containing protein [Anaeroplasmataceae bacterium]|nr:flippase-like domain-containing protein [Anaeroplasmataceae bacterium]